MEALQNLQSFSMWPNIKNLSDNNVIKEGHGNTDWSIDQKTLYKEVMRWNNTTNNFIRLDETKTKFKRLDRNRFKTNWTTKDN